MTKSFSPMNNELQTEFFEYILNRYEKKSEGIKQICKILDMAKDSVYRRLRGDTDINIEELLKLAKYYKISVDNLFDAGSNDVLFTFNSFDHKVEHVDDFVNNLKLLLGHFSVIPESKVLYASAEIPVFYHTIMPELFCFKLYVWARTVWNLDFFANEKFRIDLIPYESRSNFGLLAKQFLNMESVELWSYNIFDNTLNQIEYHLESGMFHDPKLAVKLCEDLDQLCDHMKKMAIEGRKFDINNKSLKGAPIQLYHNEIVYTNNTILFLSHKLKALFTTFCNPNFIQTKDNRICDFCHDWFDTVIGKSILISGANERQRNKYFDNIKKRISITKNRILLLLNEPNY